MMAWLRALLVVAGLLFLVLLVALRLCSHWMLRLLLSWHGWAGAPRSGRAALWFSAVKLLLGRTKRTYAFEDSLPALPIPRLTHTVEGYLDSVRPLLSGAEFEAHAAEVNAMIREHGFWLQMGLK